MSTPNDKEIAWQGRIQERAASATKAIMDRLAAFPKSGVASLTPTELRDVQETVSKQIVDTMLMLGTFVTAGAQDFQVATLEQVTIKGADKVKLAVVPVTGEKGINLDLLAQNSGKQVVVAFINGVAYLGAREALSKAIHRAQTDWINREHDRQAEEAERPQAGEVIEGTATAQVANITAHAEGELIADQPGDNSGNEEAGAEKTADPEASGEGQPEGGGAGGDGGAERIADDAGAGAQGADSGDEVPPPAPTRKPRRRGAGWAGHH